MEGVSALPLTCCEDLVASFLSGSVMWAGWLAWKFSSVRATACQSSRVHCEDLVKMQKTMTWTFRVWKRHT